ncbi:hypothetical protein RB595_000567 [Gaeumannomyces hyphopodioides]
MRRLPRHLPPSSSFASPPVPIRPAAFPAAIRARPCAPPPTAALATTWLQNHFRSGRCTRGTRSLFCSSPSREAQQQQRQEEVTTSGDGDGRTSTEPSPKCSAASAGLPFKFETGVALFAKRAPRPFPPPFLSPPSGSFSDPLSTHHSSRDRRKGGAGGASYVNGELIRGWTNGDDAVYAGETFICANDGVGAWSARPRGHSGLWARLVLHFWAGAVCEDVTRWRGSGDGGAPDPVASLQRAFERTLEATSPPNDWQGTTTATGAQIFYRQAQAQAQAQAQQQQQHEGGNKDGGALTPLLYVTNLGDSQVMVVRPSTGELVFKTKEQWHWFDCPRQLGTNSPDTPAENAVVDVVEIREGDVVLAMSDGVIDNLWPHEIVDKVCESVKRWECDGASAGAGASSPLGGGSPALYRRFPGHEGEDLEEELLDGGGDRTGGANGGMQLVADELMEAARTIAVDPFAESPYMEHAIEEGLPTEGALLRPCAAASKSKDNEARPHT